MKTRILLSLIVALSGILLATPALAEPEPSPDLEVNAEVPADRPCRNATEVSGLSPFTIELAALRPDAADQTGPNQDLSPPVQNLVNCSLWPPNCSCSCISDCHDQTEACMSNCGSPVCRWGCRIADSQCVAVCCGDDDSPVI